MFVLTLLVFTMLVVRGSSSNYFFAYYLDQQQHQGVPRPRSASRAWAARRPGWKAALDGARPAREAGQLQRRRPSASACSSSSGASCRSSASSSSKPLADRFGKKAVFIAGVSVTTAATLARVPGRPDVGRPAVLAGHPVGRRLGPDGAAAVGDDRRRGGLLGVEDLAARDRLHVRGHPVRAEGRPEPGRRAERVDHRRLRVRAERRAVRARAARASASARASIPPSRSASCSSAWPSTRSARRSACESRTELAERRKRYQPVEATR